MNEKEYQQWVDDAKREALACWDHKRGLGTIDRNGHAVLVRASVEQTAAELSRTAVRWEKDVLDKPVWPGAKNLVVFRLRGHSWTIIVDDEVNCEALSRNLQTEVIDYSVSDTCGCIGYTLFEKGETIEYFCGDEGEGTNLFESKLRTVPKRDRKDIWEFVEDFFIIHDAFEPGLAYEYFFHECEVQASAPRLILLDDPPDDNAPRIRNPGIGICIDQEHVVSKPDMERIDFLVTRESPGKVGRIQLG